MEFKWTNSSLRILKEIKEEIIKNFKNKNIERKEIKITKKKRFLAIPIPYNNPAFQLFIGNKFYKSYFFKNNSYWEEII
jgi:hypothetical protein